MNNVSITGIILTRPELYEKSQKTKYCEFLVGIVDLHGDLECKVYVYAMGEKASYAYLRFEQKNTVGITGKLISQNRTTDKPKFFVLVDTIEHLTRNELEYAKMDVDKLIGLVSGSNLLKKERGKNAKKNE